MNKYTLLKTFLTITLIIGATTLIYLYTNGFRIQLTKEQVIDIAKTGMVSARSVPEGSSVYLDGILITATDDTIPGIEPGTKTLKILRKGFIPWEKQIEIYEELVTDITAILITQSPRIEPLTNTGAYYPAISRSLSKLAYFSKDEDSLGINILNLSAGFFSGSPTILVEDTETIKYSEGTELIWSYDETQLLVKIAEENWYLIDLIEDSSVTISNKDEYINKWHQEFIEKREDFIKKAETTDEVKELALSQDILWAPDQKKFLEVTESQNEYIYTVYNLEEPLPVGEKAVTTIFSLPKDTVQPKISWYTDSYHLILVEDLNEEEKFGKISFIRIDGTNKTEIYNNKLFSDKVFSTPGGDKVIILTSFKSNGQPDIYTVSIR